MGPRMATKTDLVEDWIQIRSTLQRHLRMLESGGMDTEDIVSETMTKTTIARLRIWIGDLNALLKEYTTGSDQR
jgi:hypothetical protein